MPKTVDRLKTFGIDSLVFDPCGNVPGQGDFLTIMRQNVQKLRSVFKKANNKIKIGRHKTLRCNLINALDNDDGFFEGFRFPQTDLNGPKRRQNTHWRTLSRR